MHLDAENPALDMLEQLAQAGILEGNASAGWRFSHDTYEEFFAAVRLSDMVLDGSAWPDLPEWAGREEREHAFEGVVVFLAELMTRDRTAGILRADNIPARWWNVLARERDAGPAMLTT